MQKDTAKPLFESRFLCEVNYLQSLTDDDIELHGIPYLNDPEYDYFQQNQYITRYLTINDMVELFRRGANIRVIERDDTKLIYELIIEHLTAWAAYIQNSINQVQIPYDDLMDLDRLAAAVYPYAEPRLRQRLTESILVKHSSNVSLLDMRQIMETRPDNQGRLSVNDEVQEPKPEEETIYPTMADIFSTRKERRYVGYEFTKPEGSQ